MHAIAIFLTFIAVLGMTVEALLRKSLLNRKIFSERDLLVAKCSVAAILCFAWLVIFGEWWNTLAPEKGIVAVWWIALAVTTAVNVLIQFGNVRSTRLADISFVAPISALTPGLVLLSALLIGEYPGAFGLAGIAVIVGGTYAHAREGQPWREYFVPLFFWLIFRSQSDLTEKERNRLRALRWAYASAFCSTAGLMGDGLTARHGDMILAVALQLTALAVVYAVYLPGSADGEGVFEPLDKRLQKHGWRIVMYGMAFSVPFITLGVAFRLAPIAYVGSLKRLAIVLTVMGGVWMLGEKSGTRRILLTMVIVAGAMLIAFDPAPSVVLDSLDMYLQRIVGQ